MLTACWTGASATRRWTATGASASGARTWRTRNTAPTSSPSSAKRSDSTGRPVPTASISPIISSNRGAPGAMPRPSTEGRHVSCVPPFLLAPMWERLQARYRIGPEGFFESGLKALLHFRDVFQAAVEVGQTDVELAPAALFDLGIAVTDQPAVAHQQQPACQQRPGGGFRPPDVTTVGHAAAETEADLYQPVVSGVGICGTAQERPGDHTIRLQVGAQHRLGDAQRLARDHLGDPVSARLQPALPVPR